ncbi:helix-turn-helix transcriptional regulator [Nostoc sp. 2RC]|uniref:helix-turn-helix domain-containing protein n=1 Tax=Nostoc sp. 2RC TaxID=2485484 RepID=UPI001627856F|nr:helix-turn-helix domain-containing protein [Nostoc sp. 2RC]MBC1238505.1 helix-turn-helix domain-containing protein [Nostoc sp. 2RC]
MPITIKIRDIRLSKNLTQRQLADAIGVTESNYRKLESNRVKSISLDTLYTLCKTLECTPNDIFEVVENAEQDNLLDR